jgi:hypothetical protein
MQEFSNFKNLQSVENTKFSKFSQSLSFYYIDFQSVKKKKKLLQFTQIYTNIFLAGIGEHMVPDREMAGCFRKYLPVTNFSMKEFFNYAK